ncbi:Uncharacterized conserved protein, DUF427 family [Palleronia salina]|uniref:Uncharacterized conserved protein, DUF427 family n=2 Tax=Palleronia TaxID=315422 RepID=A0A1M6IRY5_9RHOB|nr:MULTISPECIES: DUF427 domain-containing protein [Palleronia]SEN87341.1 Uncharacterized conserved protein, DUF427 family [Palleronia pelagia]SHJ37147.1 Uncharacterized conserved protein, DUF427 family [Palleronia salina]
MAGNMTIETAEGTWVVRAGGAVLGESADALILREDGYEDVVYFPRGDLAMAFLDPSDKKTTCPLKGEATYFHIQTKSMTLKDAAWSYETPTEGAEAIAGHLAFKDEGVTVEQL